MAKAALSIMSMFAERDAQRRRDKTADEALQHKKRRGPGRAQETIRQLQVD